MLVPPERAFVRRILPTVALAVATGFAPSVPATAGLIVGALSVVAGTGMAVAAPADDTEPDPAAIDPTAPDDAAESSRAALWCSVADAGGRRLFVSDLVPVEHPTPFRVWDYQSRFARAVAGAGGPALSGGEGACRLGKSAASAAAARGALVTQMAARQWTVVTLGVF